MSIPLVIAHRGDSSNALENSLESIRRALSLSVDMIEIDIRRSRDNGLFVMHDRIDRQNSREEYRHRTGRRPIRSPGSGSRTMSRFRRSPTCSGGGRQHAASTSRSRASGAGALTAQYFASSGYNGYVLYRRSRKTRSLAAAGRCRTMPTSMIFDVFAARDVPSYKERGYRIISLRKKTVSEKLVDACHEQGIDVYVWTVDEEDEMRKFISWGVDGIYSNKPAVLKESYLAGPKSEQSCESDALNSLANRIFRTFIFDLIVIGGGITGAGVARDAALRGLSCLLLEKGDFASGVTSKSTRLIHGGLRYLANFEMDLVAESLRERAILRKQAPYLIHPMPILIPIYREDPHGRAVHLPRYSSLRSAVA